MNTWKMFLKIKCRKYNAWLWLLFSCPIAVIIFSSTIMIGRVVQVTLNVRFLPNFLAMQFNTALCFFLCSLSFLLGLYNTHNKLRILLAFIAGLIASITLIQYPLQRNLGIDTFFLDSYINSNSLPNTHMAPNTALAFIFMCLSLILFTSNLLLARYKALIISLFASLSFALGIVPLLGYLTQVETAYTWGNFTSMRVESAYCFILLSLVIISYVWSKSRKDSLWLPIPIFTAFIIITISMSSALYNKDILYFNQELENNTQIAAIQIKQNLENLIQSLERMAHRWEIAENISTKLWVADANAYIQDFSYLTALERLNKNLIVQTIVPMKKGNSFVGEDLNNEPKRQHFIQQALASRKPVISDLLMLKQGAPGFICFIPIFIDNQFSGMLVAVFKADDFFNYVFTKRSFESYEVFIYENGQPIYLSTNNKNNNNFYPQYKSLIQYRNIEWSISLRPHKKIAANLISNTYLIVLGFGLLMSLLLTLCFYLILVLYEKGKELVESEKLYRMILDGIKDYSICMLTPKGYVKSWNNAAEKIEGYTDQEILGKHFSIFYTVEDILNNTPKKTLKTAQLEGKYQGEGIRIRKDGSHFWANDLIESIYDQQQKLVGFVQITRDITDSRQMELERSQLISLIEESSDFVGIADLEGNLQYHNQSAKLMVGLPISYNMSHLKIADLHPNWAVKKMDEEILPTVFAKGVWSGKNSLLHKSGKEIPVLQSINLQRNAVGKPICLTTIIRDITELKAQEDATKASEEIFRSAMQYASMGMALVSPKGKWLKVNPALCHMIGYTEKELLHTNLQTITYPDDLDNDIPYLMQMLEKKIDTYQMEKRYFHKKGHVVWGLLSVSLLWDDDKPKYFIAQIQDVSDRKKVEEANKKLMSELADSNAELERFAYVASHDLQEPIRMINNFGEILLEEKRNGLDEEGKEYLSIMTNAGLRMRDMINDLLTYSRVGKETAKFVTFDGEEILRCALENLKTLIDEQKAVITHDRLPKLYGNPMQIIRLLQNLITNAIKYQPLDNVPLIHIGLQEEEKVWVISITDNGLGIDEQFIQEIFEPFRRLHNWESIKGSGLGLSICKKIAETHKGSLHVTSVLGNGSTFTLTLPKHEATKGELYDK